MSHPLRCRCGTLQGDLEPSAGATRGICYCRDCQAFARFLGTPGIVDDDGGTEVVASLPGRLRFTTGLDALACMSLSERGLLRWYASCCRTPIGNTPRNPNLPYVGVVHTCLENASPTIESSFGRRRIAVNTQSARHPVRSTPVATVAAVLGLMSHALLERIGRGHGKHPLFAPGTREPIRPVHVLSQAERERAYGR